MKNTKRIGIVLIVMSFVLWGGIIVVSFLGLSNSVKITVDGILLITGEVFFWVGSVFAGKEIVKNFIKKNFIKKIFKKQE